MSTGRDTPDSGSPLVVAAAPDTAAKTRDAASPAAKLRAAASADLTPDGPSSDAAPVEALGEASSDAAPVEALGEASSDAAPVDALGEASSDAAPVEALGEASSDAAPVEALADAPSVAAPPPGAQPPAGRTPAVKRSLIHTKLKPSQTEAPTPDLGEVVLAISGLSKRFGSTVAVDQLDLEVRSGSLYGIVGPNGAGKTTTLSMVTGLLRPTAGTVFVHGVDVWREPVRAKRSIGVLPDALRLFDRLTGAQLLYYSGTLRGLDSATVRQRSADLVTAFGLEDATNRLVADYSAGMTKKIALAAAMIHSPRLLILDEPFESVDPVSAANLIEILQRYVASGGTVVLSSHGMDLIQRVCDHVAIIVQGKVLASGTMAAVRGTMTLEEKFVELAGGRKAAEGMEWLHSFSD